ncbi:MAG: 5-histidylcysteine sulfoxide synthase [Candidatus Obscuribacterales bacterium]|nr:5-histidylcysteine sulfoxide synthase [Candidatus Obscuribacterales bacterium]
MSSSRNPNLGLVEAAEPQGQEWRKNLGRSRVHLGVPRRAQWWTGRAPSRCPGFNHRESKLHSLKMPNLATCRRDEVLSYFDNSWTLTELLFSSLIGDEPFYRPPYHALRHPLIFYYVHPAVLYVNKLRLAGLLNEPVNAYFESLFETGVDEMNWDDMSKNQIDWPTIDEARQYRQLVYQAVEKLILSHPALADEHAPILQNSPFWALFMSFEHERIHLETSSVLIRELPQFLVAAPPEWPELACRNANSVQNFPPVAGKSHPLNELLDIPAYSLRLGKDFDFPSYGWDNEYGRREVQLAEFSASQFLVSNGEFWQFVADGAYQQAEYWSQDGWLWRSFRNIKCPTFWVPDGPAGSHQYKLRTCFETIPMPWDWPALVNFHEAKAFCSWKSSKEGARYRLLSEAEHQALRKFSGFNNESEQGELSCFNQNLICGSESAVDIHRHSEKPLFDLFGNAWQWCEDHFNALESFKVHSFYDDFSTPCFDGQHQMIMGGSFVSTGDEAGPFARFHFRPHFFQHAGFRLVKSENDGQALKIESSEQSINSYESESVLNMYMTLHFAPDSVQMPFIDGPKQACSFPQRCADLLLEFADKLLLNKKKVLDLGCAVGGASFRLAKDFEEVLAIDLSASFINAARQLKSNHYFDYRCKVEGDIFSQERALVDAESAERVEFRQADACSLPPELTDFDAVLAANLLCRLPSPKSCLSRMAGARGIVKTGGLLLLISPFSWDEQYTVKDLWLGGYTDQEGREQFSEDGLTAYLSPNFHLLEKREMPLLIREHKRKYQYIVSQAMIFQRVN